MLVSITGGPVRHAGTGEARLVISTRVVSGKRSAPADAVAAALGLRKGGGKRTAMSMMPTSPPALTTRTSM